VNSSTVNLATGEGGICLNYISIYQYPTNVMKALIYVSIFHQCSRPEYIGNTAHWTLSTNQSINQWNGFTDQIELSSHNFILSTCGLSFRVCYMYYIVWIWFKRHLDCLMYFQVTRHFNLVIYKCNVLNSGIEWSLHRYKMETHIVMVNKFNNLQSQQKKC
jgi:hypothetical protein